jgi:hypothetical protein
MAIPIIERPLYSRIKIETSPWQASFTWTDQTALLVNGINYSQGGRVFAPGESQVDAGTLNASFKNMGTVPAVGSLVRVSVVGTAGYAFVGYVQDVSQRVVFPDGVSRTSPITVTTLHCVDWVAYVSQFQLVGVGGANFTTGVSDTISYYPWENRVAAINKAVDASYATKLVAAVGYLGTYTALGDTDLVANISNHLDLICNTVQTYWYPRNVLPTNITTGRTGLVEVRLGTPVSSGKTFTDVVGTAGQLHYTEIDIENSSQNVANTIVLKNRSRSQVGWQELTKIGGFNETNYMVINNENVVGIAVESEQRKTDSTSIGIYGNRQTEIETNVGQLIIDFNMIANPSAEYSDDGYSGLAATRVRRRKPLDEATPFAAYNGEWAMRSYQSTAAATAQFRYSGGESDGIPVIPSGGNNYRFQAWVARGTPGRADARFQLQIDWQNDDETVISSTTGALVNLTAGQTWYQGTVAGPAPTGATRAVARIIIGRSGGGNHTVGDKYWADGLTMAYSTTIPYYDGDTPWTSTWGYYWTGAVGLSPTIRFQNYVDDVATTILAANSTTSLRINRIRWNCQEDLTAIPDLSVGKTISIVYKGTTTTHRIVGIDGNIDPERYMLDLYLVKV